MESIIVEYDSIKGKSSIRTVVKNGVVLFSLEDIVGVLSKENSELSGKHGRHGLSGLLRELVEVLDPEEKVSIKVDGCDRDEIFTTQPGVFRVISRDESPACKKFQKWLFYEVLPSIDKYGTYPPPIAEGESGIKALANQLIKNTNLIIQEVEERERLERDTKEKFAATDKQLEELYERLENLTGEGSFYIGIDSRCNDLGITNYNYEMLWAWCTKLSIEENRRIKKVYNESGSEKHLFSVDVVDQAIRMSKLK